MVINNKKNDENSNSTEFKQTLIWWVQIEIIHKTYRAVML